MASWGVRGGGWFRRDVAGRRVFPFGAWPLACFQSKKKQKKTKLGASRRDRRLGRRVRALCIGTMARARPSAILVFFFKKLTTTTVVDTSRFAAQPPFGFVATLPRHFFL